MCVVVLALHRGMNLLHSSMGKPSAGKHGVLKIGTEDGLGSPFDICFLPRALWIAACIRICQVYIFPGCVRQRSIANGRGRLWAIVLVYNHLVADVESFGRSNSVTYLHCGVAVSDCRCAGATNSQFPIACICWTNMNCYGAWLLARSTFHWNNVMDGCTVFGANVCAVLLFL